MAGAIDLFAGINPIAGPNLFVVNKNPLNQIDTGVEDVIGQQAQALGFDISQLIQALINQILGMGLKFLEDLLGGLAPLGTLDDIALFFSNLLKFLGELDPLSPTFNPIAAANDFLNLVLLPTHLIAPLVADATAGLGFPGFVPMENLAVEEIGAIIGSAQAVIDAILATVGWLAGVGTAADVTQYFNDLLAMLGLPALTSTGFNPSTAVSTFITDMMHPLNLLAPMNPSTSLLYPVNVPGLDASKIISGTFLSSYLPMFGVFYHAGLNWVYDPSFEQNLNWPGLIGSLSTDVAHTGNQSLKTISTGAQQFMHLLRSDLGPQTVVVQPGMTFKLQGWVYPKTGNIGGGHLKLQMVLSDVSGANPATNVITSEITVPATGAWTQMTGSVAVPTSPIFDTADFQWVIESDVPNTDVIYLDDIGVWDTTQAQTVTDTIGNALGVPGTNLTLATLTSALTHIPGTNIGSALLASVIPGLDASKIISGIFTQGLIPSLTGTWGGTIAGSLIGSVINAAVVPALDASKIVSGVLGLAQIPNLPAGQITSGVFSAVQIPGLDATKIISGVLGIAQIPTGSLGAGNIADLQTVIDGIYQAMHGGTTTGNLASTVKPALLNIPGANIISAVAATVVPGLDASKIITGTFTQTQIPSLTGTWGKTIDGALLANAITSATLAAANVTSGTFISGVILPPAQLASGAIAGGVTLGAAALTAGAIPVGVTLGAAALTAGAIPAGVTIAGSALTSAISAANVPGLDATKIISGVLAAGQIPNLPATIITSGTFAPAQIPGLDTSKITSGTFAATMVPELVSLENTLISNLGAIGSGYAAVGTAIASIPFVNVMAPWLASMGSAIQSLSDQITSGLTVGLSATAPVTGTNPGNAGAAANTVVNAVNSVTTIANTHGTFIANQAITNPAMWGIDPTGSASFPLSIVASAASAPTINVVTATTAAAYIDTPFGGIKQSVAWMGDGTLTGMTGFYINIYAINTANNQATFVWSSGNIVAAVSGGAVPLWNYANIPAASYITTQQGYKYLAECQVLGSATYKIIGINGSWLNNNSAVTVGAMGATRTPAANLASVTASSPNNVKAPSWTLTTVTGDNCIIVDAVIDSTNSAITALTATCAGTAMTQKSFYRVNTGTTIFEYVAQFELHNTGFAAFAAGAKTIVVTPTGGGTSGTQCCTQAQATSYQNISAVSAATTTTGTTANPTQSATGLTANSQVIAHSLLTTDSVASGSGFTNPTQNVVANVVASALTDALLIQNQLAYATTVPFQGTAAAGTWGGSLFTLTSTQANPLQVPAAAFTPTLSNNTPWMMLCGAAGISQIATKTTQYTTSGNKTYTIPANAISAATAGAHIYLDIVGIGAGAGSGGGINTGASPNLSGGGGPGTWGGITLQLGVDVPLTTTSIAVHVGAGGTAGAVNSLQGGNGDATTFTITGYAGGVITCAGGLAGNGYTGHGGANPQYGGAAIDGASPGDYTFNSAPYYGGVREVYGSAGRDGFNLIYPVSGSSPGGGAAAGDVTSTQPANSGASGTVGATGYAAITVYQT
jgi:hypothetical protein